MLGHLIFPWTERLVWKDAKYKFRFYNYPLLDVFPYTEKTLNFAQFYSNHDVCTMGYICGIYMIYWDYDIARMHNGIYMWDIHDPFRL